MTSQGAGSVIGRTDQDKGTISIWPWPRFIQELGTPTTVVLCCVLYLEKLAGVLVTDAIKGLEELVTLVLSLGLFLSFALVHFIHSVNWWRVHVQ